MVTSNVSETAKGLVSKWVFARRALELESSIIRDILKVTSLPDVISFAGIQVIYGEDPPTPIPLPASEDTPLLAYE